MARGDGAGKRQVAEWRRADGRRSATSGRLVRWTCPPWALGRAAGSASSTRPSAGGKEEVGGACVRAWRHVAAANEEAEAARSEELGRGEAEREERTGWRGDRVSGLGLPEEADGDARTTAALHGGEEGRRGSRRGAGEFYMLRKLKPRRKRRREEAVHAGKKREEGSVGAAPAEERGERRRALAPSRAARVAAAGRWLSSGGRWRRRRKRMRRAAERFYRR